MKKPKPALQPTEVVLRFLESVGRRSDAELYLSVFRGTAKERFACISVDDPVVVAALDAVVLDLRFLSVLGLVPVVMLGLFEPQTASGHAERLHQSLQNVGVESRIFAVTEVHGIIQAARAGMVAIVPLDGRAAPTKEQRFAMTAALVLALQSEKLIFLQRRGGLRRDGKLIPMVNLSQDYGALVKTPGFSSKQRFLVTNVRSLVCEQATHKLAVAIASPLELLRELFTVRGAGTFLRRGAIIARHQGWTGVEKPRLRSLLSSAFERDVEDTFFATTPWRIYLDEEYRGAAVVLQTPLGAYLSKFAVGRRAQGEGIGRDLWQRITGENPVMFWRSRAANPINSWYVRQCQGLVRLPPWNIFWTGFTPERMGDAVAYAVAQPLDFKNPDWL